MPGSGKKAKPSINKSQAKSTKPVLRWIGIFLLAVLLGAGAVVWSIHERLNEPVGSEPVIIVVAPGTQLRALAVQLEKRIPGLESDLFYAWGRWKDLHLHLRAGEFQVRLPDTIPGLVEQFFRVRPVQHKLTLIEGWTWLEVRQVLKDSEALKWTDLSSDPEKAARQLQLRYPNAEGQFLPETYYFIRGTSDRELLKRAHKAMMQELETAWADREPDLPLKSPYDALILASIVEKETGWAPERPRIAGVFISRLRRGMRLQTDPTVIYGLGQAFDGNLTRRHLADASNPYNTYRRAGLPPTPIALPGREAIQAVMHPVEDGSLYFVSTGEGRHTFSSTLRDHNRAVRTYIRKQREKTSR